jgi:heparan-alpha-glucosaminide N-acetyltransferase
MLNFIPTISTMILGLFAGTWLKQATGATRQLLIAGATCLAIALALHFGGICPIVKRLWTPSWVFLSGGICLLTLAALYQLVDIKQHRRWAFPFIVIGMNSLAFYLMRHLMEDFLAENFQRHLHLTHPALIGTCSLIILCGITAWLYRRKLYLRL